MTDEQRSIFDKALPGLRLVFFEFMWPPFRWIRSVWIRESGGHYQLFVEVREMQDQTRMDGFNGLVREILDAEEKVLDKLAPGSKHKIEHTVQYGLDIHHGSGYQELMTDRVFKKVAKRFAPWRLENEP